MKILFTTAILFLIIGYALGILLPCNILPEINENDISRGEFFYYTVTAIGVFATFLTVIVALFKEDIIRLLKKADLKFSFINDTTFKEDIEDIKGTKKAKKYYSIAKIENSGNIHAANCELYLDRIEFIMDKNTDISEVIVSESKPVKWNGEKDRIYIPSDANTTLHLFELYPPQESSTPDEGSGNNTPAELCLLGHNKLKVEKGGGEWRCYYSIHSSTMNKPRRFVTHLKWNGVWEHRYSEMSKILTIELNAHE